MAENVIGLIGGPACDGCVFYGTEGCAVDDQEVIANMIVQDAQIFCGCFSAPVEGGE